MERAKPYLKVAAVVSAVCLVGAFVAYRAGAFDGPPPPAPPPAPETQPAPGPVPPPAPTPETPTSPTFMLGSKSAYVYDENALKALTQSTQTGSPANPVFMGGSKYIAPIFGPSTTGPGSAEKSRPPAPPAPVPPKKGE
jgi:hypothetical protein